MSAGMYIHSASGQYDLMMQTDGNLVVYNNGVAQWADGTGGTGPNDTVIMQTDGNLVVYKSGGLALWDSRTGGSGNWLSMQDDGNLVIYNSAGHALWATGTAGNLGGGSPGTATTAVNWANSQLGRTTGPGGVVWDGNCLEFVQDAWAAAGVNIASAGSALAYWNSNPNNYQKVGTTSYNVSPPPLGALVFWGDNPNTPATDVGDGHVAISLGNGSVDSTTDIRKEVILPSSPSHSRSARLQPTTTLVG